MSVLPTFALILVLLAVGGVLRWRRLVPDNAPDVLNLVALYVCLPASILLYAPKLEFAPELLGFVAIPYLVLLATIVFVWPLARLLRFDRGSTACLLMQVPLGNTSYIGYSLVPVLAGSGALGYAVVYDQFGTFILLLTWGLVIIAAFGGTERPTMRGILWRMLTFPPFPTLVFALTLMPADPPAAVAQSLQMVAGMLLPLVIIALGMQLRLRLPRQHLLPLCIGLVAKLVLMPLLALGLCMLFGITGDMRLVAVYETAMPSMITAGALLSMAGLAPELAAAMIGYGIVLSMLTLPLWHHVLGGG
ncbi:AEC family transporter [Dokdonella sp.]|uniref:AEC family transporter n=1 Tax=Dokdonella sp. TaxID=2291710 RepID=UPI0025C44508|nr:AEC family transporter [Dokdonella sp.]MBX3690969.1 AEC family transporter [Dokdonella sp.]